MLSYKAGSDRLAGERNRGRIFTPVLGSKLLCLLPENIIVIIVK
jgi:hypothetical protein